MSWLTTPELQNLIKKYGDDQTIAAFIGIYSMDTLPQQILQLPVLLIVNTHASNLPGEHWKAIYISSKKIGEVFDSLAMPISVHLQKWMNAFTRKWSISKLTIQNPLSSTCGAFTLYFVLSRLRKKSMKDCVSIFTKNLFHNDMLMRTFVNELKK
ncbi:MAG: hypothetical protein AAGK05_11895 [Pseudomonadota bacterium]